MFRSELAVPCWWLCFDRTAGVLLQWKWESLLHWADVPSQAEPAHVYGTAPLVRHLITGGKIPKHQHSLFLASGWKQQVAFKLWNYHALNNLSRKINHNLYTLTLHPAVVGPYLLRRERTWQSAVAASAYVPLSLTLNPRTFTALCLQGGRECILCPSPPRRDVPLCISIKAAFNGSCCNHGL